MRSAAGFRWAKARCANASPWNQAFNSQFKRSFSQFQLPKVGCALGDAIPINGFAEQPRTFAQSSVASALTAVSCAESDELKDILADLLVNNNDALSSIRSQAFLIDILENVVGGHCTPYSSMTWWMK